MQDNILMGGDSIERKKINKLLQKIKLKLCTCPIGQWVENIIMVVIQNTKPWYCSLDMQSANRSHSWSIQ